MRKLLIVATLVLLCSCKTGYIDKELKGNLFNKFDYYGNWDDKSKVIDGRVWGDHSYKGVEFNTDKENDNYSVIIYPQKNQFYIIYNLYNSLNYNLKQRGKFFGDGCNGPTEDFIHKLKIGIWYEYDINGKLIKKTDEDKKFGKFGYNEVLKFVDMQKKINLHKGVGIDGRGKPLFDTSFHYSDKSDKKLWTIVINKPNGEYEAGYFIDGNTGKVIEGTPKELNYYREIGVEF